MPIGGRLRGLNRWRDGESLVDLRRLRDLAVVRRLSVSGRADVAEALPRAPVLARRLLAPWLVRERSVLVLACLCEAAAACRVNERCPPDVLRALRAKASAHGSPVVRAFAVAAVSLSRDPSRRAWLRGRLREERSAYARCSVLEGLASLGEPGALDALSRLALSRRLMVRVRASDALRRLHPSAGP